jgi:hypothetical protein
VIEPTEIALAMFAPVHEREISVLPIVATDRVGALGVTPGIDVTDGDEYAPVPTVLTAAILK